ncbi:SAGA histone acetylase and TREX-2 complexes component [Malassezia sp. CBS 17886]|nr:SAGA histone acetylase and TREX-2 complexes component [Malassezia sp. CBS 17886]
MSDADDGESCGELLNLLHQRLVATGEWSTLLLELRRMLEDSGWDTQLRQQADKEAASLESLHVPTLVAKLSPYAEKTLPDSVRASITARLNEFLDRNLEDA